MPNRCRRLEAFGLFVWLLAWAPSQGQSPERGGKSAPRPGGRMQASASSSLSFTASQKDGARPLASEEGADFSLVLENRSGSPVTLRSIDNFSTPRYTLHDSAGRAF